MNREQRRALVRQGYAEATSVDVAALERAGGILWEPGKEGIEGWAVCPCCGERQLHVFATEADS